MLRSVLQNEDFKQDGGGDVIGVNKSSIFCPLHFYYLCSRAIFMGNMLEQRRMRCTTILMILEEGESQVSSPSVWTVKQINVSIFHLHCRS